jgi:hypothetical protein
MSAQAKKAFAPTTLGVAVLAAALAAFLAPIPARSGTSTFRIDPEALSGRITQFLEGESEVTTGTSQAGVKFGNNIMLSDEHFANRLISQTEPSIAVNPANPNNLVAGFHDLFPKTQDFVCRFTFTTDAGSNWTRGGATPLQTSGNFCSDPAIAADASGNFFYAYLDINFGAQHSDVDVAKSTDGGQTFSTFTVAVKSQTAVNFPDKEYIAVDTTAGGEHSHPGRIYVTWTDFLNPQSPSALDNGQINVVFSGDGGATWSAPVHISPDALAPEAISGSNPVVAPDGTVFVFYADFTQGTGPLRIRFSKSINGGVSWSTPADVATGLPSPGRFRLKNADPAFGTTPGRGFRSNSFPTTAIAPDGTIFVAWVDFPGGSCTPDGTGRPPCTNSDVRLAMSSDGGATWMQPVKATDEKNASDQFFPWIATHPDGRLSIIWQDKRLDSNNINFNTFYTSTTTGVSFRKNVRVSSATSITGLTTFIGDYNNEAVTSNSVFPVWTDRRFRNNDIFTAVGLIP